MDSKNAFGALDEVSNYYSLSPGDERPNKRQPTISNKQVRTQLISESPLRREDKKINKTGLDFRQGFPRTKETIHFHKITEKDFDAVRAEQCNSMIIPFSFADALLNQDVPHPTGLTGLLITLRSQMDNLFTNLFG